MQLRFRFKTLPFIVTLLLVGLGIALGNWQVRRAAEKTALQALLAQRTAAPPLALTGAAVDQAFDPAAIEYRRVTVTGEFISAWPLYLDNRPLGGRSGFIVLMPFTIAGSKKHVLVARGWLPRDPSVHDRVPPLTTPAGVQTIAGMAVLHPARTMQLGTPAPPRPGAIVQNLDAAAFARASGLDLLPLLVEQTDADAGALVRAWPSPALGIDRHKGYAFQWYALAVMAFLFFVMTGFRRGAQPAS